MDSPSKSGLTKAPVPPQRVAPHQKAPPVPPVTCTPTAFGGSPTRTPESFRPNMDAAAGSPGRQAQAARDLQRDRGNQFAGGVIQRKCACGGCADCDKKRNGDHGIQRQAKTPGAEAAFPPEAVAAMQSSSGKHLAPELRERFESQFGHSFEEVLIHTDSQAAKAAAAVNARAFTSGRDIYFAQGEYQPETAPGRELIAHELTHVVQQRSGRASRPAAKAVDSWANDPLEQEADRVAAAARRGTPIPLTTAGVPPKIQRASGAPTAVSAPKALSTSGDPLEQEAERAAADVAQGRAPNISAAADGVVRRKAKAGKCTAPDVLNMVDLDTKDALVVPEAKGLNSTAKKDYKEAVEDCRLSTLSTFTRPSTETLRNTWKRKSGVNFPTHIDAGGFPCEVDHIVELQVGGTNDPKNLQLLTKSNNASSGSIISKQVAGLVASNGNDKLRFTAVTVQTGRADECLKWEQDNSGGATPAQPLALKFGNRTVTVDLPKPTKSNEYSFTGSRRQLVAGMDFEKIVFIPDAKDHPDVGSMIRGKLASGIKNFVNAPQYIVELDINNDHTVKLRPAFQKLKTAFPFLSEAEFNAGIDDDGYTGSAKFHPSLPLLKKGEVTIQVVKGVFSGGYKASAADIAIPIPGVTVTECSVEAAIKEAAFSAQGTLAFKAGAAADAKLTARADKDGFRADGVVDFHVPGLDKAQGKVSYRDKQLTGQISLGKDKFKFPGIKSAHLTVDITDTSITGLGEVQLAVPGVKKGTLSFALDKDGNFAVTGAASLSIPGLKEAEVSLTLADGDLTGLAKVGLDVPGLQGADAAFEVRYAHGALTGSGELNYQKGKLTGKIHAAISEKHKLSGGGELAYEIFPGLVAGVGIEILESGKTKVSGEIRVPDTIDIFPEKAYEKKIFSFNLQIPIFAIPLGTRSVGLVADIGADIKARAGIGPGQLRGVKAKATIDLSKDDNALEFQAAAELFVPASAELTLAVHGGLGLSLAIASATGGIELTGSLGLKGALSTKVQINYKNGVFALDAVAEVSAQPSLRFDINAYVKVEVDLFVATIEVYRKDWKLASKEWGSGLKVAVRFPVHYETGKPFAISLDQLEFTKPEIDIKQAVKDLLPM